MKLAIGCDHGGFELKEEILKFLKTVANIQVSDLGPAGKESVDYPDYGAAVGRKVASGEAELGIVVCGTGIGISIAANKVPGIRAALVHDVTSARLAREHNHANILVLGAGLIGENLALEIVQSWLSTPWGGERHARRVEKITEIERRYLAHSEMGAMR